MELVGGGRRNRLAFDLPDGLEAPGGYLILEKGVFKETDDGLKMIATAPFYINGRLLHRERGETSYIVELVNEGEKETLLVKCTGGARAITRAVESSGVFLRGREVAEYIAEYLEMNWTRMQVADHVDDSEIDIEFESVYDQFVQNVRENEDMFEENLWGRFGDDMRTVYVRISVMNDFLKRVGIKNKKKTLSFWKNKGVLHTDGDGKHLSRPVRIGGHLQRAYVLTWPDPCENDEEAKTEEVTGLKPGDKADLVDLKTGSVMMVQLQEVVDLKDAGSSKISVESPLGKALMGKGAGDIISVEVDGMTTGQYKVLNGRAPEGAA